MGRGKIAPQVAHASWGAVLAHFIPYNKGILRFSAAIIINPLILIWYIITNHPMIYWFKHDFVKIVLKCKTEEDLLKIHEDCINNNIKCCLIYDKGLTHFNNVVTLTCLGIGPDYKHNIDKVTQKLRLLG
jgi:peptidyl-tRNA hydrolase